MAPAINDPISATASDLCAVCPKDSTTTCVVCENIKYCSAECQQSDVSQHDTLCSTFKDFQQRPSDNHYRAILFPVDDPKPRFIWLLFNGDRGFQTPNHNDLAQYLPGDSNGGFSVSYHYGISPHREIEHSMSIDCNQNALANHGLPNMCFSVMIGPHVGHLRHGTHLGRGWKYTNLDEKDAWDEADRGLRDGFPLIALDLDTTSLGPLLARIIVGMPQDTNGVA